MDQLASLVEVPRWNTVHRLQRTEDSVPTTWPPLLLFQHRFPPTPAMLPPLLHQHRFPRILAMLHQLQDLPRPTPAMQLQLQLPSKFRTKLTPRSLPDTLETCRSLVTCPLCNPSERRLQLRTPARPCPADIATRHLFQARSPSPLQFSHHVTTTRSRII